MKNSCSVSVVVPVCNVQRYLRQCLDSLTSQTLQDIQIICIDDGSTDGSLAILEEYAQRDARIEVIAKPNAGYGHTMNMGFAAARGEYVGIVESDDFVDVDMFEKLYELANEHGAEVVKSNFYQHESTTFPDDDPIVENLAACCTDAVFCPLDDQNIFLTQPAIWSALYSKEFLEREGIKFLETPGASFQDTAFNFKVFAAAEKVVLTKEAYLHYRIDNASSSVKSLKKVFCICDEYREIWDFASSRKSAFERLKCRIPQIQFGGYLWNLERLTPALQYGFYERFVEDFSCIQEKGFLKESFFDEVAWREIKGILDDPDGYFEAHYGPISVDTTVLVLVEEGVDFKRLAALFPGLLGERDEVYFNLFSSEADRLQGELDDALAGDSRIHLVDGQISNELLEQIDLGQIRGERLIVVRAGRSGRVSDLGSAAKETLADGISRMDDSWFVGSWSVEKLKSLQRPVLVPLLCAGLYCEGLDTAVRVSPKWLASNCGKTICGTSSEYEAAWTAFKGAYDAALPAMRSQNRAAAEAAQKIYEILWGKLGAAFDALPCNERKKISEKPSPCFFDAWLDSGINEGRDTPKVAVIIPVYNSRKYLSRCMESVLSQSINELQVVCVDDGSNDGSLDELLRYAEVDGRVRVVAQLNGGAGAARNRGIELAVGEYYAFIDPDDEYPDDGALLRAFNAAKESDSLLVGGSFVMLHPDGRRTDFFGGEQGFYTIRREGVNSLRSLQTDYGWIRFLYHSSLFDDGEIRFPEYRWYEDPVFFTKVMSRCDEFYGIASPMYRYYADYKKPSWSEAKVRDMLKGVSENLEFARTQRMSGLYSTLVHRLNRDYYSAIMEFIEDEEVFTALMRIQGTLDLSLLNDVRDNGWATYVIRPLLDFFNNEPTAVVRLAKKVEKSSPYKVLQFARERLGS